MVKCLGGISTSIAKGLVLAAGLPLEIDLNSIGDYEFTKLWQQIIYLADIIRSKISRSIVMRMITNYLILQPSPLPIV